MVNRKTINENNVTGMLIAFLFNSKKAMLGNLIGGFIVILIGVSLIGPIAQELANAADCMDGNINIEGNLSTSEAPKGETDSFGGAGSTQFGGYDNKVKHKSFTESIAATSLYKTDKSILNPDCTPMPEGSWGRTILTIVPAFFALAILGIGLGVLYSSLKNSNLI
jgi:hypothetical protein